MNVRVTAVWVNHVTRLCVLVTCCALEHTLQLWCVSVCVVTVGLLSNQSLGAALPVTSVDKHSLSVSSLSGDIRLLGRADSRVFACVCMLAVFGDGFINMLVVHKRV